MAEESKSHDAAHDYTVRGTMPETLLSSKVGEGTECTTVSPETLGMLLFLKGKLVNARNADFQCASKDQVLVATINQLGTFPGFLACVWDMLHHVPSREALGAVRCWEALAATRAHGCISDRYKPYVAGFVDACNRTQLDDFIENRKQKAAMKFLHSPHGAFGCRHVRRDQSTALMAALNLCEKKVGREMLRRFGLKGCRADSVTRTGWTALMTACRVKHEDIAMRLLEDGAEACSAWSANVDGETAWCIANKNNLGRVIRRLEALAKPMLDHVRLLASIMDHAEQPLHQITEGVMMLSSAPPLLVKACSAEQADAVCAASECLLQREDVSKDCQVAALRVLGAFSDKRKTKGTRASSSDPRQWAERAMRIMSDHSDDFLCQHGGCVVLLSVLRRVGKDVLASMGTKSLITRIVEELPVWRTRASSAIQGLRAALVPELRSVETWSLSDLKKWAAHENPPIRNSSQVVALSNGHLVRRSWRPKDPPHVGTKCQVHRSVDNGETWSLWCSDAPFFHQRSVMVTRDDIIVFTSNRSMWSSADEGATWQSFPFLFTGQNNGFCLNVEDYATTLLPNDEIVATGGCRYRIGANNLVNNVERFVTSGQRVSLASNVPWEARRCHQMLCWRNGTLVMMGGERSYPYYMGGRQINDGGWWSVDQGETWTQVTAA